MEYKCGCKTFIDADRTSLGYQIEYCPLHKSAPDLYEALKSVMSMGTIVKSYEREKAQQALSKAETKNATIK